MALQQKGGEQMKLTEDQRIDIAADLEEDISRRVVEIYGGDKDDVLDVLNMLADQEESSDGRV